MVDVVASLRSTFHLIFPSWATEPDPFESLPPRLPADLFAFAAYVLDASGAYHHIAPTVRMADDNYRAIRVTPALRDRARETGTAWVQTSARRGRLPPVPTHVTRLWHRLKPFSDDEVFVQLEPRDDAPRWWIIALELLMIADEASRGLGFDPTHPFYEPIALALAEYDVLSGNQFRQVQRGPHTLSTAERTLLCVQAKSLTPAVGCTLRSLTHHLALLPGQGQVRARWVVSPFDSGSAQPTDHLGLLLVPFPYRVGENTFRNAGVHKGHPWGWFEVAQSWLPDATDTTRRNEFIEFVVDLVRRGRTNGNRVEAVILPELALDFSLFRRLALALAQDRKLDFLISGISNDRDGRVGNFVAIAPFFMLGAQRSNLRGLQELFLIREKHHRWKLNEAQIKGYALEGQLDPDRNWWERLNLLGRSLDILAYRGDTTLTTMICEDLARVDPCQAVLRAIGPNLVVALLMDGPQLSNRWSARYATVLADDPGSSVLSFTSLGLISRQNDHGRFGQQSAVGLWKDEVKGTRELELPRDADALCLTLKSEDKVEHSLDGRSDQGTAVRWVLESVRGVAGASRTRCEWISAGVGR